MRHCLCWLLLAWPGIVPAEVYGYRDASGTPMFTDRAPHDGAQPLTESPINRMPATVTSPSLPVPAPPRTEQRSPYQRVSILFPAPDAVHPEPSGDLRVAVGSEPALLPDHRYRLLLDGQAQPTGLQLRNLDRGSHRLAVEIVDQEGRILVASAEQAVHIQRPSLLHKRRLRPCQPNTKDDQRPECQQNTLPLAPTARTTHQ